MLADNPALARKYWPLFEPVMEPGESLLTAYTTISVDIGLMLGRGSGDGAIGITDQRVIFLGIARSMITIDRSAITGVKSGFVAIPKSREVTIDHRSDGQRLSHRFIVGSGFAKDMLRLLR